MRVEYAGAIYRRMIRKTCQNEPNYESTPAHYAGVMEQSET